MPQKPSSNSPFGPSSNEVWSYEADEFPRRDDLRTLPEHREMLSIAGHQIIGASCVSALNEDVVIRIACHFQTPSRRDQMAMVADELE